MNSNLALKEGKKALLLTAKRSFLQKRSSVIHLSWDNLLHAICTLLNYVKLQSLLKKKIKPSSRNINYTKCPNGKLNWESLPREKKKESLTTNKLNYACQDVNCTQLAKAVHWAQKSLSRSNQWACLYCLAWSRADTCEQEGEELMLTQTPPSSRAAQGDFHLTPGCVAFRRGQCPSSCMARQELSARASCSPVLSALQGILLLGHLPICIWET